MKNIYKLNPDILYCVGYADILSEGDFFFWCVCNFNGLVLHKQCGVLFNISLYQGIGARRCGLSKKWPNISPASGDYWL